MLNNAVNRLILVDTINTLGTAITWTGLPIFALNLTGSFLYAGSLYLTETIAGIISTIVSGHFIDKVSSKKMIFSMCKILLEGQMSGKKWEDALSFKCTLVGEYI